jgi:membrane peptidoglycan carboxypeptidase
VGNSDNSEMQRVTGAIGAAVVWRNMMETFYNTPQFVDLVRNADGSVTSDFYEPEGLIKRWACSNKGDVNDLFLAEAPPTGCTTYRDKNPQLRSAPSNNNNNNNNNQPRTRPTPIPGIVYPTPQP